MGFQRVKDILDNAITTWQNAPGNDNPADLSGHGPTFSWASREALLAAVGHGKRLIQPEVIGIKGLGKTANLIIDLRTGFPGAGRMPKNGPFISDPEIQEIEDWIEGGCLE